MTNADGIRGLPKHQGNGTVDSGNAADCYTTRDLSVYIPPNDDPVWDRYASAVVAQDLVLGQSFATLKDFSSL